MAMVKQETVQGFQGLPALRQIGLMIGLAASVALGVAVVLWSQEPNYTVLYAGLGNKDAGEVVDALKKTGIAFEVDQTTGAVMVASNRVRDARMELAREGLPEGSAMGFEMLQKDQGFGTSQFIETARYQRALEGELGRTISTLRNIESARVHLAIPKRSVFLRDRAKPTASVMVDMYSGRSLDEEQVAAIVHLVSSSVPHLEAEKVTIVDQKGNLLSNGSANNSMAPSSSQFSYNRKLETTYTQRIRDLLEPVVGPGRVRATVNADLDFTVTERTQESYNPDLPALRSEQVSEDISNARSAGAGGGIPGALSNQPAEQPTLVDPNVSADDAETSSASGNRSKRSVRNYELDKTISHTRLATGGIRKLSIAVVIDNKQELDENDELVSKPWSDDEISRFSNLVKESVGFNAQRGDTVNIINASFVTPPEPEPVPELSLMEQPWIWDVAKQAAGALGLLVVVFGVLKPVMRSLAEKGEQAAQHQAALAAAAAGGEGGVGGQDQLSLTGGSPQLAAPQGNSYEQSLETAKSVVNDDPKRVAQVVKNWVGEDG
ncbi:flagellar M-ring protein FliF [Thiogranum longum]|uniref:Flagellar M-ring protein n=1 Tax=Thiogranum longum TaxID=1537524 RepID=A0A4V2PH04_9GAMM|nr:flagellar basal-body MS-ring/collar protein FliF [Thiogranum longum]TCK18846.1 flagellar M-ring protein FliF [Thiogranum longum]